MKKNSLFFGIFVGLFALAASCGDDTTVPMIPDEELIIGTWESVVHREDGQPVEGEGFRVIEFREDGTVLISEFESDGSPINDIEETWMIDDDRIFFTTEVTHDIINLTETEMTLEYDGSDPFSGQLIRYSDDFEKQ